MSEYIKREDALEKLQVLWDEIHDLYGWGIDPDCKVGIDESMRVVSSVPSADVGPVKHGEWEDTNLKNGDIGWRCSVCGFGVRRLNANHYCPNCGARMDGKSDE